MVTGATNPFDSPESPPFSDPFPAAWLSRLMEYVSLIVVLVVWTVIQAWVLPRLGVPT